MSEKKHTPLPWRANGSCLIGAPDDENPQGYLVAQVGYSGNADEDDSNREFILQCVNACAWIEDPEKAIGMARTALSMALHTDINVRQYECIEAALSALTPKEEKPQ